MYFLPNSTVLLAICVQSYIFTIVSFGHWTLDSCLVLTALASATHEHGNVPSERFSLSRQFKSRSFLVAAPCATPYSQLADAGAVFALYILVNMIRRRGRADPGSVG